MTAYLAEDTKKMGLIDNKRTSTVTTGPLWIVTVLPTFSKKSPG